MLDKRFVRFGLIWLFSLVLVVAVGKLFQVKLLKTILMLSFGSIFEGISYLASAFSERSRYLSWKESLPIMLQAIFSKRSLCLALLFALAIAYYSVIQVNWSEVYIWSNFWILSYGMLLIIGSNGLPVSELKR